MTSPTIRDIPIWLINLPSSVDRYAKMENQLRAMDLSFIPFEAVNGREEWDDLKNSVDVPRFEKNVGRTVMPGEVGCYLSHLKVWQAFLETDAPAALVLEDDVLFHDDFCRAVDAALTALDDWDIVKLNFIRAKFPIQKHQVSDWKFMAYVGAFTGTGAYLINRAVVEQLCDTFLPIVRPIDHELDRSQHHKIRHFGLEPYPSHVADGGQSTITGSNHGGVEKFATHRRLQVYVGRVRNFFGKLIYALRLR